MSFRWMMLVLGLACVSAWGAVPEWQALVYAPAALNNPLKGLVPYASAEPTASFPHSMEYSYFPLSSVVSGPGRYDWRGLDAYLDAVASRGHQAIFRFYLEYPGKLGIPDYLLEDGLAVTRWGRPSTPPRPPAEVLTPDYAYPGLQETLTAFISALGRRYDGDPRIGFVEAGLLGLWGEWHDYPRQTLFADKVLQGAVMDAYAQAFRVTPVLLRYPAGEEDAGYASNVDLPLGYHDDSFAWSTLPTKSNHFLSLQQKAGVGAMTKWQRYPIAGEIRPEAWGKVFDEVPEDARIEDFAVCVQASHVSWLMDSGMFRSGNSPGRQLRASQLVQRMGYEFYVTGIALDVQAAQYLNLDMHIENRGVAPFYYHWPLQFALMNAQGKMVRVQRTDSDLTGILPGAEGVGRRLRLGVDGLPAGPYKLLMQVPNSLSQGLPVRFANQRQDADLAGWLTLASFSLPE